MQGSCRRLASAMTLEEEETIKSVAKVDEMLSQIAFNCVRYFSV